MCSGMPAGNLILHGNQPQFLRKDLRNRDGAADARNRDASGFVLSDMEQDGICIDANALKEYGQKLSVSIGELLRKRERRLT